MIARYSYFVPNPRETLFQPQRNSLRANENRRAIRERDETTAAVRHN